MANTERMKSSAGFPPIAGAEANFLILGSLPSQKSLLAGQYYAHPQNVFWRIMAAVFGVEGDYSERCRQLMASGVAVWDVLACSVRPGSMDVDIEIETAQANDFAGFLSEHAKIERIGFNGQKAEQLFRKLVVPEYKGILPALVSLPSTSPAYAALSFDKKLKIWNNMLLATTVNCEKR